MPELAATVLREAATADGSPAPSATDAAEARAAAQAAQALLGELLQQRVALLDQVDTDVATATQEALGRVLAMLAQQPTDYQLWQLPRLLQGLTLIADQLAQRAEAAAQAHTATGWTLGQRLADAPLAAADQAAASHRLGQGAGLPPVAGPTLGLGQPDLGQLRALQAMTTGQIRGATAQTVSRINTELSQVVLGTQTPFQAQQAIAPLLTDRTQNQLRAVVHLGVNQATSTATFARLQAQAQRDPDIRKMWRRSGKPHSRENHDAIDGEVKPVAEPFTVISPNKKTGTVRLMYPCDPAAPVGETINCGCTLIPWKAGWQMLHPGAKPFTPAELAAKRRAAASRRR